MRSEEDLPGALSTLKRTTIVWSIVCAGLVAFFLWLRWGTWDEAQAVRWGLAALLLIAFQNIFLWRHLGENYDPAEGRPRRSFGLANWLTLTRGLLVAFMAGFLVSPVPADGWIWFPGAAYLLACCLDYLDGYAARSLNQPTKLGESLDMSLDGSAVLVGALLAWHFEKAPAWFVLVGLARYLFLFGGWLRRRAGKPLYELGPNPLRRMLAGSQMLFIGIILLPIYPGLVTKWAATFFMLPFLIGFLRDWLSYSGSLPGAWQAKLLPLKEFAAPAAGWLPLALRGFLIVILVRAALLSQYPGSPSTLLRVGVLLACIFLCTGLANRAIAVGLMLAMGYLIGLAPLQWEWRAVFLAGMLFFFAGPGRYSKWSPENELLFKRAGEVKESRP